MAERLNGKKTGGVLSIMMRAIYDAKEVIEKENDKDIKDPLTSLVKKFEDDTSQFFRENVDRRKEVRDKPLIEDVEKYYKVYLY